jgi:hypothetical protein
MMLRIVPRKGNKKTRLHVKRMPERTRRGVQNAFNEIKKDLKKDAQADMRRKKSGRVYLTYVGRGGRRLKNPRKHRASARGETPAVLTGALSKSLGYVQKYGISLSFGADTPYARFHERFPRGKSGASLSPGWRSYLLRTINSNRRNTKKSLETNIETAVKSWKARATGGRR